MALVCSAEFHVGTVLPRSHSRTVNAPHSPGQASRWSAGRAQISIKSDSICDRGSAGRRVRREVTLFPGGNFLGVVSTMGDTPETEQGVGKLVVTLPLPLRKQAFRGARV